MKYPQSCYLPVPLLYANHCITCFVYVWILAIYLLNGRFTKFCQFLNQEIAICNLITNYCPISLLSNISKVLECLIYYKIIHHVTPYIEPIQFGFMSNRSTIQQLLIFLHEIFCSKYQTDTIYLDISKAFDSVSAHLLSSFCLHNQFVRCPYVLKALINIK